MSRYREIEVFGSPREMGRQIGEAAREEVRAFCSRAMSLIHKTIRISYSSTMEIVAASLRYAGEYSSDMVEELRGIAEAADVSLNDLMLLQVRNQLSPDRDAGCTSVALVGRGRTGWLVAQNWDNDPDLDPLTVVLTRRPTGKPALMNLTQAGLIAYIGFNERGIGLCLNSLPAPARKVGVPHYFTVRGIYESDSLDGAVAAVRRATRAIPANIMLATPQGPADLEVTIDDVYVLTAGDSRGLTHANHCRHPQLVATNQQFPELIQSHDRQRRVDQWLDATTASPGVAEVQAMLRDHEGYPRSICRHANDDLRLDSGRRYFLS